MATQYEPIALIGSACRFPGGSDTPSKLWELLRNPRDLVRNVPPDRFDADAYYHPEGKHHGTSNVRHSYFLDQDAAVFDNGFFNIQAGEAEAMDPQQRLLMETVYESLCAAGQTIEGLRGSPTSVFVGVMCGDWDGMIGRDIETYPQYGATGAARSIMSNRISYFFDWHGPCMTIDTACSSSLVAVHQAIQTLRSGESEVAIAAGANLILSPAMYVSESKLSMLSPNGRSRMWDKDVDGYARGEGIASVILKPLSAALRDNDHIECLIRGTGVNQDGKTLGLTMPSGTAQAALIRDTYRRAGLNLDKLDDRPQFFHAHGTGTAAGDPQEAQAISVAFYKNRHLEDKLYVGSIKTIIGHTEGTAGLASLIGTSLALQNATIPPNLHFHELNPKVEPFYHYLEVPTTTVPWPETNPGQPRRASINSFGFGGTNAHAILEAYEPKTKLVLEKDQPDATHTTLFCPLTFSAASEASLRSLLTLYSEYIQASDEHSLHNLAYSLQTRTSTLSYRVAVAASTKADMVTQIGSILGNAQDSTIGSRQLSRASPKILGVFTGQGSQWARMGARLLEASPYVAYRLSELDSVLAELPDVDAPSWTLQEMTLAGPEASRMAEAAVSQPLCTAVQIVLVDLLRFAGVKLEAVIGHSSGEIGAAYAAGLVSAGDAMKVAYYRGLYANLARSSNGAKGSMMAVGTTFEDATEFCELEEFEGRIQVAARNSSSSITLSGDEDAVLQAIEIFQDEGKFARQLRVDTAYHSAHVLACSEPYLRALKKHVFKKTSPTGVRWYSSVRNGEVITSSSQLGPQYWVDNMTNPVLFSPAAEHAWSGSGPFDLIIEVGPHPVLKTPCLDTIENITKDRPPYTGLLGRTKDDVQAFSSALGFIWTCLGPGSVDFENFQRRVSQDSTPRHFLADLPKYPFDHSRRFMSLSRSSGVYRNPQPPPHPLLGRRCYDRETPNVIQWRNVLTPTEIPWLLGHQIEHQIVLPATGYVAMAIEAIHAYAKTARNSSLGLIAVRNFLFHRALVFNEDNSKIETLVDLRIVRHADSHIIAEFSCNSGSVHGDESILVSNAVGTVEVTLATPDPLALPGIDMDDLNLSEVSPDRFYKFLAGLGYNYECPFRGVQEIRRKADYAVGSIKDQSGSAWEDRLLVHPGMLDTALQTCFAAFSCPGDERMGTLYLPTAIRSIIINPYFTVDGIGKQTDLRFLTVSRQDKNAHLLSDIHLFAGNPSRVFLQLEDVKVVSLNPATPSNDVVLFSKIDYKLSSPDGEKSGSAARFTREDFDMYALSERIAFYYFRTLLGTITELDLAQSLPHYRHLYNYGAHMMPSILRGEHAHIPASAKDDTHEYIVELINARDYDIGVRLLQSVGENLPASIRSGTSILQHIAKDSMMEKVFEEGSSLDQMNAYIADMVAQIAHRYPLMNIFEVGAGTGGATKRILATLGSAFSRYTCTDISSGFFSKAEYRFKDYGDRVLFKKFDMDQSPQSQGFDQGTYDMVICSNVLHASADMHAMMKNVRSLLKPGGYVVILEIVANNLLRAGLVMGSLPGWWLGVDSGRTWGPALSLPQWDTLLAASGFGGIETWTPHIHDLVNSHVFCAQAVDERIDILRSPLSHLADYQAATPELAARLVILGGKTLKVSRLVDQVAKLVQGAFSTVTRVPAIEELDVCSLNAGITLLSVTELDEPIFAVNSPQKFDALKKIWSQGGTILWLTSGARAENPHSQMTNGVGRCVRAEHPNITLQLLDVDRANDATPLLAAEYLLRLKMLAKWSVELQPEEMLWSLEPEVYVENGEALIPRLYPYEEANKRYNTTRRIVQEEIDPQNTHVKFSTEEDSKLEVQRPSPLQSPGLRPAPFPSVKTRTVRVTQFLLATLNLVPQCHLRLVAGIDIASQETVLAVSPTSESPATVPLDWTIVLDSRDSMAALSSVSSYLAAHVIVQLATSGDTLVVHEPHPSVAVFLQDLARTKSIVVHLITSQKEHSSSSWTYLHKAFPERVIKRLLPSVATTFLDLSDNVDTTSAISRCLPPGSRAIDSWALGQANVHLGTCTYVDEITSLLKIAWTAVDKTTVHTLPTVPLHDISLTSPQTTTGNGRLIIVDCTSRSVHAVVRPIDDGTIFRADRTYLLAGLSGELGQSLCKWMVEHGARHVVLTSRRPKINSKFNQLMEQLGAQVQILVMDVTSRVSARQCYDTITQTMPPVAGVVNGAMVLRDSLFEKMPYDDFVQVTNPKVLGSLVLDELFRDTPLDFFIFFSSTASFLGNRGQSNYVAGNQFMCSLAAQRKKRGAAASSIDISSIIGIGYVERDTVVDEHTFLNMGYRTMAERDLHYAFAEAILLGKPEHLGSGELVTGIAPLFLGEQSSENHFKDPKVSHFILDRQEERQSADKSSSAKPVRVQLAEAKTKADVVFIITKSFLTRLHRILAIAPDEPINEQMTFVEQGVDSLMAVEVRSWFVKELAVDFPVLKILGGSSIGHLLDEAARMLPATIVDLSQLEEGGKGKTPESNPPKQVLGTPEESGGPGKRETLDKEIPATGSSTSSESTTGNRNPGRPASNENSLTSPTESLPDSTKGTLANDPSPEDIVLGDGVSCPMSLGQEGFWFLDEYLCDKTAFNMAVMIKLTGPLRIPDLEEAVDLVGKRHEILRTRFFWAGDGDNREARQEIMTKPLFQLTQKSVKSEAEAHDVLTAVRNEPWDLGKKTSKIFLLTLSDQVHFLIISMHHILADGYTFSILWKDLERAYMTNDLPPLPIESQYRSFARQQRLLYDLGALTESILFHKEALASNEAYLQPVELLPFSKTKAVRRALISYRQEEAKVKIRADVVTKLRNLGRMNQATTFHVYLSVLQAVLFKLLPSSTQDIFIGMADANRLDKQFMNSAGFFLNLLPLHFHRSEADTKFSAVIQETRDKVYGALSHSHVPFDILLRELHVPRSSEHMPLFQVFVDYKQIARDRANWAECKLSDETWRNTSTGYDIVLDIQETPGVEAILSLRLQRTLYSNDNTQVLLRSYVAALEHLANAAAFDGDEAVGNIPAWSPHDLGPALAVGRGTRLKTEWPSTITHRIDEMIAEHGDRVALKDGDGTILTYKQLGARVDDLANALLSSGTPKGAIIGVFQEPSSNWICSMLAIMRTGRVYVPLDLRNTTPRLAAIVEAVRPVMILTNHTTIDMLSAIGVHKNTTKILNLDLEISASSSALPPRSPNLSGRDAPAVILFTSGSTGVPKCIVLRNENIVVHAEVESQLYGYETAPNFTVLHQAPYSFDLSIDQIFNALANGGCLVVIPARSRGDPKAISETMVREKVTYASCTPAEFDLWLRYAPDTLRRCDSWQYAFSGGEAMSRSLALELQSLQLPQLRVFSGYGPSETTIWMAKIELDYSLLPDPIPAGRLLPGYACVVVDENLQPVPLGVLGEIVIGGPCVGSGYLHDFEATQQKFIPDTFFDTSTQLYRTGDCGRLLRDGTVQCEGRLEGDTQVKLRGFRIELAEIERVLVKFADGALSQAVVTVRGSGEEKYLAAHVIFSPEFPRDSAARERIIRAIRHNLPLPPYMRPSAIVALDDVPLTAHDKVDRRAVQKLPVRPRVVDLYEPGSSSCAFETLTGTELKLSALWRQVMPVDPGELGQHSDFFLVGGNSLLLVKLQSLLRKTFAVAPKLVTLMGASTLGAMAAAVEASQPSDTIDWEVETRLPEDFISEQPQKPSIGSHTVTEGKTILLTGSRGCLGRHLLLALAQDSSISRVYCLVRDKDDQDNTNDNEAGGSKICSIQSDLSLANLGLTEDKYATIIQEIDAIVHCAANRSLWDRYDVVRADNYIAVREMARLAHAASPRAVPMHVLSSGAVVAYGDGDGDDITRTLIRTPPTDGSDGYLASKWAAETFLRRFAAATETPIYIHRPEPVAGCEAGAEIITNTSAKVVIDELVAIAHRLGLRPTSDGVRGFIHVTPVASLVSAIHQAVRNSTSGGGSGRDTSIHVLHHRATVRIPIEDLENRLGRESAARLLPSFPVLDWFGKTKREGGFSHFVTSWELTMGAGQGLVSRR